jgi:alkylated DNA repair dioxygenase AlkB
LAPKQLTLFGPTRALPEGFRYQPEIVRPEEDQSIVERTRSLPFKEFEFQGFVGKRRTVSFGWRYDFNDRSLQKAEDIPDFLLSLRQVAAEFAELPAAALQQVLVTEYDAGAAIGWHRDKKIFGDVVGISLLSACRFRFRRKSGSSWERAAITAEPRSVYLLRGPSRTEWEHSIPAVETLRYSITYRSLLEPRSPP